MGVNPSDVMCEFGDVLVENNLRKSVPFRIPQIECTFPYT